MPEKNQSSILLSFNTSRSSGFWWNLVIKAIILIGFVYVLKNQLGGEDLWGLLLLFTKQLDQAPIFFLVVAIVLMPFNWWCEAEKWGVLMRRVERLSLIKRLKSVAAGVTFSIFTPNRIGEYGGRILFVRPENNWRAIVATLVGSYSQWVVLLVGGLFGAMAYCQWYLDTPIAVQRGLYVLSWLLVIGMLIGYFNMEVWASLIQKLPNWGFLQKLRQPLDVLRLYHKCELERALGFAFLRYLIYSLQYYMLLRFFGVEVDLWTGFAGIATIYLVQTSIPLPPFMGLIMRGEVALQIWGLLGAPALSILASTFCLWALNIIVPALVGMVFIADINIIKSLGYDRKMEKRRSPKPPLAKQSYSADAARMVD